MDTINSKTLRGPSLALRGEGVGAPLDTLAVQIEAQVRIVDDPHKRGKALVTSPTQMKDDEVLADGGKTVGSETSSSWPGDGYCYRLLFVEPVDLGAYPQGSRVCAALRSRRPAVGRFNVTFYGNRAHVAHAGPAGLTALEVETLLKARPNVAVGGLSASSTRPVEGYCYLSLFDPAARGTARVLGPYPTLGAVCDVARIRQGPVEFWLTVSGTHVHVSQTRADVIEFCDPPSATAAVVAYFEHVGARVIGEEIVFGGGVVYHLIWDVYISPSIRAPRVRIGGVVASTGVVSSYMAGDAEMIGRCAVNVARPNTITSRRLAALGPFPSAVDVARVVASAPRDDLVDRAFFSIEHRIIHVHHDGELGPAVLAAIEWNGFLSTIYHAGRAVRGLANTVYYCDPLLLVTTVAETMTAVTGVVDMVTVGASEVAGLQLPDPFPWHHFEPGFEEGWRFGGRWAEFTSWANEAITKLTGLSAADRDLVISYFRDPVRARSGVWEEAMQAVRSRHEGHVWPAGQCYQALFRHPIDLGDFPTSGKIFDDDAARAEMCANADADVYWRETDGLVHLSRVPFEGSRLVTVGYCLSVFSDDSSYTVGALAGECYLSMFDECWNIGAGPFLLDVVRAGFKRPAAVWHITGVGRYLHVDRHPSRYSRAIRYDDFVDLFDGKIPSIEGRDRLWWAGCRVGYAWVTRFMWMRLAAWLAMNSWFWVYHDATSYVMFLVAQAVLCLVVRSPDIAALLYIAVACVPWQTHQLLLVCSPLISRHASRWIHILPIAVALGLVYPVVYVVTVFILALGALHGVLRGGYSADWVTFGSRGDTIPIHPYVTILTTLGVPTELRETLNPLEGRGLLAALESGNVVGSAPVLKRLVDAIEGCTADIVFAPLSGLNLRRDVVTFSLAPPPHVLTSFNTYEPATAGPWEATVNLFSELLTTTENPDIRFGAYKGCAPRSADGECFLRPVPNRGLRENLVALGSSAVHEPRDLDPAITWSTSLDSIYRHEPRTNHNEMFADYRRVLSHNGAGTAQTARAAGCEVVGLSRLIDRDIANWDGFTITDDVFPFFAGLCGKRGLLFTGYIAWLLVRNRDPVMACRLALAIVVPALLHWALRGAALAFHLRDVVATVIAAPSGVLALEALFTAPLVPVALAVVSALGLNLVLQYATNKYDARTIAASVFAGAKIWFEELDAPVYWIALPHLGVLWSALASRVFESVRTRVLPGLTRSGLALIKALRGHTVLRRDKVWLRMVRLHSYPWLNFPFCHWELFDPTTAMTLGVNHDNGEVVPYHTMSRHDQYVIYQMCTTIDVVDFPNIVAEFMEVNTRRPYRPWRNCQTALLRKEWFTFMGMILALVCVFSSATLMLLAAPVLLVTTHGDVFQPIIAALTDLYQAQGNVMASITVQNKPDNRLPKAAVDQRMINYCDGVTGQFQRILTRAPVGATLVVQASDDDGSPLRDALMGFPYSQDYWPLVLDRLTLPRKGGILVFSTLPLSAAEIQALKIAAVTTSFKLVRNGHLVAYSRREGAVAEEISEVPSAGYDVITKHATLLAKVLKGGAAPLTYLLTMAVLNTRSLVKRLRKAQKLLIPKEATLDAYNRMLPVLLALEEVIKVFDPPARSLKPVWAPVLESLKRARAEELGIKMAESAVFMEADYDDTLRHYVAALNESRGPLRRQPLSLGQFRRSVNRSPYVDLVLQKRYEESDCPEGVDGQIFACKEVMTATLARYVGSRDAEVLTDYDVDHIARAIVRSCPSLYENARLADPKRLLNHWMKHPSYSAGLPFISVSRGRTRPDISTRRDVKKAGWFSALEALATLPLTTGVWFPSIAHAFPKSQVVDLAKLRANPAKLRSVTATSIIDNLQKGVLNFDVNNRHDYGRSMGKPGIPLNGSYLGDLFAQLDNYRFKFSIDCTQMDSNLPGDVFRVQAAIRKIGYENHPAREFIEKHIDAAMQKTQRGYIVNLITLPLEEAMQTLDSHHAAIAATVDKAGWDEMWRLNREAMLKHHETTPGGYVVKGHGGYTGDSDTTWTNTVGLQIMMFTVLSDYLKLPYDELAKRIFLANVGDDNMLGLNVDDVDPVAIVRLFKKKFGIQARFEAQGGVLDQKFLGKVPRVASLYRHEFERLGIDLPTYAVLHDAKMLRTRYYNFKAEATRHTKKGALAARRYFVLRAAGVMQLTAHQPELYAELAADARQALSKLPKKHRRGLTIPAYDDVVRRWYTRKNTDTFTALNMSYGWARSFARGAVAAAQSVEQFAEALQTHLIQLESERTLAADMMVNNDFIFEEHAWHCFVERNGAPPSATELDSMLRMTPYYSFTSARLFTETVVPLLDERGPGFEDSARRARDRLVVYTALYMSTNKMINALAFVPGGTVLISLFNLYTRTLPQLYAAANYVHYLATATSSAQISALIPKDVYYHHKAVALSVMKLFPRGMVVLPIDTKAIVAAAEVVSSLAARLASLRLGMADTVAHTGNPDVPKAWTEAAILARAAILDGKSPIIVAPTGTGKTRWFPQAYLALKDAPMLVICLPRKVLCEDMARRGTHYKRNGTQWPVSGGIVCATYGHIAALYATRGISGFPPGTAFLLDECHESAVEIEYLKSRLCGVIPTVLMTATPEQENPDVTRIINVDVRSPYTVKKYTAYGYNPVELFLEIVKPHDRILIIDPRKEVGRTIARTLNEYGHPAEVVNAEKRSVPQDLRVHIVATSIVDAGINIEGITKVIDTGYMLANNGGALQAFRVSPTIATQRAGRTGRFCDGEYYVLNDVVSSRVAPVPSLDQVLSDSPMAAGKVRVDLDPISAFDPNRVLGNNYARFTVRPLEDALFKSLSFYHALCVSSRTEMDALSLYKRTYQGCREESAEYFMSANDILREDLVSVEDLRTALDRYTIHYLYQNRKCGGMPTMNRGIVGPYPAPPPPDFKAVANHEGNRARKLVPWEGVQRD